MKKAFKCTTYTVLSYVQAHGNKWIINNYFFSTIFYCTTKMENPTICDIVHDMIQFKPLTIWDKTSIFRMMDGTDF